MAFSPSQQGTHFRPMVDRAWRAHCDRECITESTEASKDAWYRQQLKLAVGKDSSKTLNKSKDFDQVMAHFEEVVDDGSIYWQSRALQGSANRARHKLTSMIRDLRLEESYIATIADKMRIRLPIRTLSLQDAIGLRIGLLKHIRRRATAATLDTLQEQFLAEPSTSTPKETS